MRSTAYHTSPATLTGRDDTEDGSLARRVYHAFGEEGQRAIIGFACEAGVSRNKGRIGAKEAPDAIRNALANLAMPSPFTPVVDMGNIVVDGDALEDGQALLARHVAQGLNTYEQLIVLGGGHETAFGSWSGLRAAFPNQSIGIVNLDAHLDLRNPGIAGVSSGTPFNQIRHANPDGFDYLCIGVARESNTEALLSRANEWGVSVIRDTELACNPDRSTQEIEAIAKRNDILYLTIDMDVLPHYQAPGVSAPAARGVPLPTIERIVETVHNVCQRHNCKRPLSDIVEVSPRHDRDNMTVKTAAYLALKILSSAV